MQSTCKLSIFTLLSLLILLTGVPVAAWLFEQTQAWKANFMLIAAIYLFAAVFYGTRATARIVF